MKKIVVILALVGSLTGAPALADQKTLIALRENLRGSGITLAAAAATAIGAAPRNTRKLADALEKATVDMIRAAPPEQAAAIAAAAVSAAPQHIETILVAAVNAAPERAAQIASGALAAAPKEAQDVVYLARPAAAH